MENVIEIKNVNKNYKTFSLSNISFSLKEGEIIGIIGENGAGKSTLFKLLAGVNFKNSGEIKIFDKDINELKRLDKERISFILDELNFPLNLKIKELHSILSSLFISFDDEKFNYYLNKFDLDKNKKIKELSKGMKVKLNFVVALSHHATLFILDEPTNGLDPIFRDEILDILLDIKINGGSIIISSHIVEDLAKISDHIIFIHEGKILLDNLKTELVDKYEIIVVDESKFNNLDKFKIIRYKNDFDNKISFITLKDNFKELDSRKIASLSDLMVYFVRGKTL